MAKAFFLYSNFYGGYIVMDSLNNEQKKAVTHFKGPCMVIGTPGSGKTRVITERVHYLVQECKINPSNILVITFTKAAAVEMKRRYYDLAGNNAGKVQFGTFHAIFFTILKIAYNYTSGNIIHDNARRSLLREIVAQTHIEIQDENEFLNDLESEISLVKGGRIDLEHYYPVNCPQNTFKKIFSTYQNELIKQRLIDFDDMLVYCYELLSQRPDILRMWQKQYPFILIDEFQDINRVQYDVIKLLAKPGNNIFIVGDDDQSIYGFRGAKPGIMQQFLKDYKGARKYGLNINYRCSSPVVEAAGNLIKHKNRISKKLEAAIKTPAEKKTPVYIMEFNGLADENNYICRKILEYHSQGIPYKEIAVLFRTNIQARALTSKLMEYNIPFIMKEHLPNIYEHWIAKDILAYIRIALGDRDRASFLRVINKPKRYVHRNAFTEPYVDIEELKLFYEDKSWMIERIEQFQSDLKFIASLKPFAAVNYIRKGAGYDDYIKEYADYRGIHKDGLEAVLDELQEEAKSHKSFKEWFEYIELYGEELKEQAGKSRDILNGKEQEGSSVTVLTMHGAKGLEYNCVFIPDANDGVTPHNKAVLDDDIEEERRMFYVAMTRARKYLYICYVKERFNKEAEVSCFVREILNGKMGSKEKACKQDG